MKGFFVWKFEGIDNFFVFIAKTVRLVCLRLIIGAVHVGKYSKCDLVLKEK